MNFRFYFNGGEHMILHEYHTYETYSFIADIGGYLVSETVIYTPINFPIKILFFQGLCLGASLLSFYDLALEMSSRAKKYFFKSSPQKLLPAC